MNMISFSSHLVESGLVGEEHPRLQLARLGIHPDQDGALVDLQVSADAVPCAVPVRAIRGCVSPEESSLPEL